MRRSLTVLTLSVALGFGALPAHAQEAASADNSSQAFSADSSEGSTGSTDFSSNGAEGSSTETVIGAAAVIAAVGGIAAGAHWAMNQGYIPNPFQPPAPAPAPAPAPRQAAPVQRPHYPDCKAVWDHLGRPIRSNEPGYHRGLDRDGDGVGCERRP